MTGATGVTINKYHVYLQEPQVFHNICLITPGTAVPAKQNGNRLKLAEASAQAYVPSLETFLHQHNNTHNVGGRLVAEALAVTAARVIRQNKVLQLYCSTYAQLQKKATKN